MSDKSITSRYGNRTRIRVCGITIHQNKLLLVRHSGLGEEGELWSFPGGGAEFGEDLKTALKREYLEETGLEIDIQEQQFVYEYIKPPLHAVEIYFRTTVSGGHLVTGTDPEMDADSQQIKEVKLVTFAELSVIKPEKRHEILRFADSPDALQNLSGYFKF